MRRVALVALTACGRLGFDTVGDAARSDALDAPGDGAPACLASYELCDGFEGPDFGLQWTVDTGVTIDTTIAHRGAASAHMQLGPLAVNTGGYANVLETATLALGDTTFYVRAYVRLAALPAGNNGMELLVAAQTVGMIYGDYLFVKNGHFDIYTQFSGNSTSETTSPQLDTWTCVLWSVTRATTTTGSITLGGDPAPLAITSAQTDATTPPITRMSFGIGFASTNVTTAQPQLDVWIDDLIVTNTPVTCAD